MQKYFQKIPRTAWILIVIVLVGFSFRIYRHHDYLRFNPDQARDASLIGDVADGKIGWPLLGPQAGGTDFRLGGAFYQIEIASAKIFGSAPDRLAFPDLFFSILSIVLLHFFLREFFDENIALLSSGIFAVSFYAVKYARFAWNPNSTPFYVLLFLYAILQLTKNKGKREWLWALAIGVAAGIGVQLHSLLLFSMPIVFVFYFGYLFFKKNPAWKWAPFILLVGIALNASQIVSEMQTGGKNTQAFFQGMHAKSSRKGNPLAKFILDTTCHVQVNSFMLLPLGNDSQCDFINAPANLSKKSDGLFVKVILAADIIFAVVFSVGGYWLLFKHWRAEKDESKKRFLEVAILYAGTLFVLLIPLAAEISFRFFLVLEFMPCLLLAFWLKYITECSALRGPVETRHCLVSTGVTVTVAVIAIINIFYITRNFAYLAGQTKEGSNGFEEITLGEVQYMAKFIETHSGNAKNIYLQGKAGDLFEMTKPIQYFTNRAGLDVNNFKKNMPLAPEDKVFSITVVKNPQSKNEAPRNALASGQFNRIRIYAVGE